MFEQLNIRLQMAKEEQFLFEKLEKEQEDIVYNLKLLKNKKIELERNLQKEEKDVLALKKLSLTSLFYSLFGDKAKKISKEEQEFLTAKLMYENCAKEIELLETQLPDINSQLEKVKDWKQHYEEVMATKEQLLIGNQLHEKHNQILSLTEEIAQQKIQLKELDEALNTGNETLKHIKDVSIYLEKASTDATLDTLGIFGIFADISKHSNLDKGRKNLKLFQTSLPHFEKELKDVHIEGEVNLNIGSFLAFSDFFFDGFIVDILVGNKIKKALNEASRINIKLLDVLAKLKKTKSDTETQLYKLDYERKILLEELS